MRANLLAVVVLFGATSAQAGDRPGEESLLLDAIPSVFGASKYEQRVTEAPATVSIITAADIEKYGYRTVHQALRSVRGFYVSYDRNYTYTGVRGFSIPGDYDTRVLVLVDGHRVNDPLYDSPYLHYDAPVHVDQVARIEVIRGPGSSLYGSNALFAVINIVTKRGRDLQGAEVTLEADTLAAFSGRLAYGRRLDNGVELLVAGSARRSLGQDLYFAELDSPETRDGRVADADDATNLQLLSRVSYETFSLQGVFSWNHKGVPTAPYESVFPTDQTQTLDSQAYLELKYEDRYAMGLTLMARLYYDRLSYEGDWLYDYAEEGDDAPYLVVNQDETHADALGAEVRARHAPLEWLLLVAGVEIQHDLRLLQRNFDEEVYVDDERTDTNLGVYLQSELTAGDELTLNAGLRFDWYASFGTAFSPRIALIYQPLPTTSLKALYGEAFRAPNAYELYYVGYGYKRPRDLDPERIRHVELSWEQEIGENLRSTLSGYFYHVTDLIRFTTDAADGLYVFDNAAATRAFGVELGLHARWSEVIEGHLSYALQRSEDADSGRSLTNSPRHLIQLNLAVPIVGDLLLVGLDAQYMSPRRSVRGTRSEPVALLNLNLLSRDLVAGLRIFATLYNVLDLDYGDPGSEEHVQHLIPQDGIHFRGGVSLAF